MATVKEDRRASRKEKKDQKEKQQSEMQRIRDYALDQLEQLGGKAFSEEDVLFQGDQLILPANSNEEDMIKFLQNRVQQNNEMTEFSRTFEYRPWDVGYCTFHALRRFFGAVNHTKGQQQTFFGIEETPPQFITINTGPNTIENIPWGGFRLPFLPKVQFFLDSAGNKQKGPLGQIRAVGAKKWQSAVEGVFRLIEAELHNNSLYKGKVFDGQQVPQFLDLSSVDPSKIVFAEETTLQIDANLWSAIRYMEAAEEHGLPFKRALLFTGDFGVGKTLAINRTLQIAEEEGITGILVRAGRDDLQQAMATARMYQPSIVAFEDVEVVADADQEDRTISMVLDMFDGIEAKNSRVMLVLTSNHVERLHRGMLRPGRLDAVIRIGTPDQAGIKKLVEVTIPPDRLDQRIDWANVATSMDGYLPAFVVEAAQRAVRYSLARNDGKMNGSITEEDLIYSGDGLREQFEMMQGSRVSGDTPSMERVFLDTIHRARIEAEGLQSEPGESPLDTMQRYYA